MSEVGKMCPMLSVGRFDRAACAGENCAWWDRILGACYIATGADCIRETQNQLNVLNTILEKVQGQGEE